MKYFSDRSTSPVASPKNGFWVKEDEVHDVTEDTHVGFIISHRYRFNLTIDDITLIYDHYGEEFGSEKQAREDLVRIAASQGWIRVRRYAKPNDYWSIQCDDTSKRREVIQDFLKWAIGNRIMTKDATAIIAGFDNEQDVQEYKWEDGGIGNYLNDF
jgi:hypothetical protein